MELTKRFFLILIIIFFETSCNSTKPLVKNKFDVGYFEIITKLNFDKIASTYDTTWQHHLKKIFLLMKNHKEMTTMFRTYTSIKSSLPDEEKSDYLTLLKIIDYFKNQGITPDRIGAIAGGNSISNLNVNLQPKIWEKKKMELQEKIVKKYKSENYVLLWTVQSLGTLKR